MVDTVPYQDHINSATTFERRFPSNVAELELVWHRDYKNREITVIAGTGWQFQLDNQMPVYINPGDQFVVAQGVYHRILRGFDDLVLQIREF